MGPDQLNDGTQPSGAVIWKREDSVGPLQVNSLESSSTEEELAPPNLGFD
jgi:hypothetical protein